MQKVRISELPLYTSLDGLYLIATDSINNKSVKVPIADIISGTGGSPDPAAEVTYEKPVITNFSYDDIPADGGSSMPTITFTQGWTDTNGNSGTLTQATTDYSVAYTSLSLITGASVNLTTGEVSMSQNGTVYSRQIASVQAIVTANGQESVPQTAYVTQEKGEITYTYSNPSVTTVYDYLSNTVGETISPSILVTQTREGSDGSVTILYLQEGEYDVSFNADDSGGLQNATLNTSTGVITCTAANSTTESLLLGMVNTNVVANGKSGSTKTNIYQAAGDVTYEYSTPKVTLAYATMPNGGGELSPTYSYTQTRTGNDGSSTVITSGGSLSWSISNKASDVSFDTGTGEMMCLANGSDSSRTLGTVQLSVTLNGKTGAATAAVTQAARTYSDEYAWSNLRLSYPTAVNTAGTVSPSGLTYTLTRTRTYSDGTVETDTWSSGASVTYSISATGSGISINSSTGAVSFTANTSDSQKNLGTVTATLTLQGQTATVKQTVYQAARTYEYSDVDVTLSYTDADPLKGATAIPTLSYQQTRTGSDGSTAIITSGGTVKYSAGSVYDDYMVYDSSTGVVTMGFDNTTSSRRIDCTMIVTVTLNGKTGTAEASVYQAAAWSITEPVAELDTTIFQEETGSGTVKVYFNVDITLNDARLVSPSYFIGYNDEKCYVNQESVRHEDGTSGGYYTGYSVELLYHGVGAFSSSRLYSAYEGSVSGNEFSGEVASSRVLVNDSGSFYIRQ